MSVFSRYNISTERRAQWLIVLSGILCSLIFLMTIPFPHIDGHLIGSDGMGYYAILRSVTLDHDFDFSNDLDLLSKKCNPSPTGLCTNPFAIGAAILWLPFFLIAHFISLILYSIGIRVPLNGVGYISEAAICLGTIIYASIGFLLTYRVIRKADIGDIHSSLIAVLAMWWGSQAIYYIIAEPSMSHGLTIFTISLFLYIWYPPSPDRKPLAWGMLGLSTALVALGRWQDGIIVVVPIIELIWWIGHKRLSIYRGIYYILLFGLAVVIGFIPQFIMWHQIYGSFLTIPQGENFFTWMSPHWLQALFSTRHGLLLWHPIWLLALLGVLPLMKKNKSLAFVVIVMFLGQLYINSAAVNWWADDAFGGRRFTSLIPLMSISLASLISTIKQKWPINYYKWLLITLFVLVVWNGLSLVQYRLGFISKSDALSFREFTIDRILLPVHFFKK